VVNHCRIKSRADRGQVKYYLIENKLFESLYGLITFYRQHPLKSHEFEQVLTEPVPQPESHRGKEYVFSSVLLFCVDVCSPCFETIGWASGTTASL